MGLEEFWHSTPGEISAYLEGASHRASDSIDLVKLGAWCVEILARQDKKKRLMPLSKWLERQRSNRAQTPEEQMAIIRAVFNVKKKAARG